MKRIAAIAALIAIGAFAVGAAAAPRGTTAPATQPQASQQTTQTPAAGNGYYPYCYGYGHGAYGMHGRGYMHHGWGMGRMMGSMMGGPRMRRGAGHPWYYWCEPWHW